MAAHDHITSKRCNKCGETKPLSEFWADRRQLDGTHLNCRVCGTLAQRAIRKRRRELPGNTPRYTLENPAAWLEPDDRLVADGYDFAWCFAIFREISGFPAYMVGSNGSVWSRYRAGYNTGILGEWQRMKPYRQQPHGHRMVCLYGDRGMYRSLVHRLVLEAFVGPCPDGMEGCHYPDRDPGNNNLWNLRWDTPSANSADAMLHGTKTVGVDHFNAKVNDDDVREMRKAFDAGRPIKVLGREYGLHPKTVTRIVKREGWKHVV